MFSVYLLGAARCGAGKGGTRRRGREEEEVDGPRRRKGAKITTKGIIINKGDVLNSLLQA